MSDKIDPKKIFYQIRQSDGGNAIDFVSVGAAEAKACALAEEGNQYVIIKCEPVSVVERPKVTVNPIEGPKRQRRRRNKENPSSEPAS
jgi:hypothetical protein